MNDNGTIRLLSVGVALEVLGLVLAIIAVVWFDRVTMLVLFGIGFPALLLGMACYLVVVVRDMMSKGVL